MKQHRILWTLLVTLIVASLALTACGGTQETPEPAPVPTEAAPAPEPTKAPEAQPAEPTAAPEAAPAEEGGAMMGPDGRASYAGLDKDLTGQTIRMANIGGAPYEAMYEQIKLFEEKTGAKVEIVFLGDGFQIDRYLKENYAADTVDFDVAWNHTSFMSQYTPFVEDLNQYFTPEELAAFSPAIIQAATIDGALQLIPRHADISAMHYRTDLFGDADLQAKFKEQYGYDLKPPETIDQMKEMAEFFVDEKAIDYGTQFAGKEEALAGRFYELLVANGGNYFDEAFEPIFNSEAGMMTAEWMRELYEKGAIPSDTPNLLWPEVAQNFCDGKVAFYLEWYGWYSYFQNPESCKVAGQFDLTRGPVGADEAKHTGWAGAHAFSIPKAAENKEGAAQLIKFLSSQQVAYDEAKLGLLPVRDDVWKLVIEDAGKSDVPLDKKRLEVAQQQISEDFFTPPLFADWISFTNLWYPALQSIILGDTDVETGLNDAVEQTRTMMEEAGYYAAGEQQQTLEKPAVAAPAGEAQYAGLDKDLSGITIRMANIGGSPYEAMYDTIKKFEEETGAKVEIVFLGDGFQIDRYLKENYAADTVDFDVAWNHTSFMSQYTPFVEDLNQYFTPEELAAFSPAIIQAATIDGALQLIPRHADISSLHYRTDLFGDADLQAKFKEKYGYDLKPPETIDQMKEMAEFFVDEGAIEYGTQFAGKEEALAGRFYELLVANGGNYFDEAFEPIFNSEAGMMTAEWMRELYEKGAIPSDTPNLLWPEVAQNFCDGKVAFYLEWYGWYGYFQDPASCKVAGKFDMVRGPLGAANDKHTGWAGAHAFSIPKAAQEKEAAAQLIKFLTSEQVAYEEAARGSLPVRDDVWARIIADASNSDVPLDKTRLELAQQQVTEDFFTPPLFADWISFTNLWYPALQSIILGDTDAETGLNDAVEQARTMMEEAGYYNQ